jgi:microcystin-dependent protein
MGKTQTENELALMLQAMSDKVAALEAQVRIGTFQAGDIRGTASAAQLDGWLPCDGRNVKASDYPSLYAVLAAANFPYGGSTGSATCTVPDLRGRVPLGAGTGTATGATAWALGATPTSGRGGEETHVLLAAESGVNGSGTTGNNTTSIDHLHSGTTGASDRDLNHAHHMEVGGFGGGGKNTLSGSSPAKTYIRGDDVGGPAQSGGNAINPGNAGGFAYGLAVGGYDRSIDHLHAFTTGAADRSLVHVHTLTARTADSAHNNMQPITAVNFFIKT